MFLQSVNTNTRTLAPPIIDLPAPLPPGNLEGNLAELVLISKDHLVSTWSGARVIDKMASVFSSSFGLDENKQLYNLDVYQLYLLNIGVFHYIINGTKRE